MLRPRRLLIAAVLVVTAIWFTRRPVEPKAPPLPNAYGDLVAYWDRVTGIVGVSPTESKLHTWLITYGPEGAVESLTMWFHVDRGNGRYDAFHLSQQTGRTQLNRVHLSGEMPKDVVPARAFFKELTAVGLRQLEGHSNQAPPIHIWVNASNGGYGGTLRPHLIQDGRIVPVGPEGLTGSAWHANFVVAGQNTSMENQVVYVVLP